MATLDIIRGSAEQISKALNQKQIRIAAYASALIQDKQVQIFFETLQLDPTQLHRDNVSQIVEDDPREEPTKIPVPLSAQVEQLINDTEVMLENNYPDTESIDGLISLYVLLEKYPHEEASRVFWDNGITNQTIKNYLIRLNNRIDLDIDLSLLNTSSNRQLTSRSYEYVLPSNDERAIAKYTSCLNDLAFDNKLSPTVGREEETAQAIRILRRKGKNNPLLLGEAGVGKTAIAEGLAQLTVNGSIPADLANIKIFSLDLSTLIAGTMYRGDFEKRIKAVLSDIKEIDGAILFIDEIHMIMGAGAASSPMDVSNILKPALARGEISCMGATTYDEYRKHISKDPALARRFGTIDVLEPSIEEAQEILFGIRSYYEQFHDCIVDDDAIRAAVTLSDRYITDRYLPDKAIDVIDEAGALMREIPMAQHTFYPKLNQANIPVLTKEIIAKAVEYKTGLPAAKLSKENRTQTLSLKKNLNKAVFDQSEAVEAVSDAFVMARSGIGDESKPIGSFLFTGPTGVGKTELVKQLSTLLDMELIRLDMSEYMEKHSVSRLVGAPPGYVGYDEGGLLTEAVHRKGHSVVLLDEIEKAHPDVFNVLLQVMDEGQLSDATGKVVNFKNTILVMTSNAGAGGSIKRSIGFSEIEEISTKDGEIETIFSPEFRNRLDGIVKFNPLKPETMPKIVTKMVRELSNRLLERGISLSLAPNAVSWIAKHGFDDLMGARPLKRLIKQKIEKPIAYKILEDDIGDGNKGTIIVDLENDNLSITFKGACSNDNRLDFTNSLPVDPKQALVKTL